VIRLSATTLEAYRRVVETEYASESELIASIRGERIPETWQMAAGSAWDNLLSGAGEVAVFNVDETTYHACGGFTFKEDHVEAARKHLGPGLWQVKVEKFIDSSLGPVCLVAKVDKVRGLFVDEVKAKFSTVDARNYERSLQWKLYLLCHEAAAVRYSLFDFANPDKARYCDLRDIVSFRFWRYRGLEQECRQWVEGFLDWASSRGLMPFLQRPSLEAA